MWGAVNVSQGEMGRDWRVMAYRFHVNSCNFIFFNIPQLRLINNSRTESCQLIYLSMLIHKLALEKYLFFTVHLV